MCRQPWGAEPLTPRADGLHTPLTAHRKLCGCDSAESPFYPGWILRPGKGIDVSRSGAAAVLPFGLTAPLHVCRTSLSLRTITCDASRRAPSTEPIR